MDDLIYFYPDGHEAHQEPGHPERPERVETIRTALIDAGLWDPFPNCQPLEIPVDLMQSIHSPAYLNMLELTCRRSGHLDMDTYTTPASWRLAWQSAGGASAVASQVWEGKARRGFAMTRPPGHHAMRGQGMGFCLLNNIAIAAEYLLSNYNASRVAIIDLDLHHGNGTQEIFWEQNDVFYCSTHQAPLYPGTGSLTETGAGPGEGWTANIPLPPGSGDEAFISAMDGLILPLLDQNAPEIILVSYGFDPHWMDPLGQLLLTADGLGKLVKKLCDWADNHCKGRIALILEGGYDLHAAAACTNAVISALLGREWNDPYPSPYPENGRWQATFDQVRAMWNL